MNLARLVLLACLAAGVHASATAQPSPDVLSGVVVDSSGAIVVGASVIASPAQGRSIAAATTAEGRFALTRPRGTLTLTVAAEGFDPLVVSVPDTQRDLRLVLLPMTLHESVNVQARASDSPLITAGTKAPTPLRNVPQAVSVVTHEQIRDLNMQGIGDVMRYVPGAGVAQGESNRDAPVLRGTTTTGDFFLDGVRDDAQYFRDLYNVERVEVLKGPNAMAFGRGGVGGVVNRVSKQAGWTPVRELSLQAGSWDNRRLTADLGGGLSGRAAFRVAGVFEDSGSYRRGAGLERQGLAPSLALTLGDRTMAQASVEYFHDRRTADRGIPSVNGKPVDTDASTFFGNADLSWAEATVNSAALNVVHVFTKGLELRNQTRVAAYDKFYQNVYPGAVNAAAGTVAISAYNHSTDRANVFNQSDLLLDARTGPLAHRLAIGTEIGRQASGSLRKTGHFATGPSSATSVAVPISDPEATAPVTFMATPTDADLDTVATVTAVYAQDQVRLGRRIELIGGVRFDRFQVTATNNRTGDRVRSDDRLVSPRAGVVFTPLKAMSLYSSFTISYQPRAGEQLTSLSLTNRTLEPETFRNVEAGVKWDVAGLSATAAVYRLDRGNVAIASPDDPTRMLLVDGQRMKGLELGLSGRVTRRWQTIGAYAFQRGRILTTQSATVRSGALLGQVPAHAWSVWNRYDLTGTIGAGLGMIHRGDMFVAADDAVVLPAFTRVDAALFVLPARQLRLEMHLENLLNTRYYASAHSNNNITPGSPRALRVGMTASF